MTEVYVDYDNALYVRVSAEPSIMMELSEYFEFFVPGYKFIPSYKNKVWDGKIRLFHKMTGRIYGGLLNHILKFCQERNYSVDVHDRLLPETDLSKDIGYMLAKQFNTPYTPRDYQNNAVCQALYADRGLYVSPTASGKSFIIYLIARHYVQNLKKKVLIIVPTTSLVSQMDGDFTDYNNGTPLDTHKIMAGVDKDINADYTITTWQSIYKLPAPWYEKFDVVVGDEAHLFKAKSLTKIMEKTSHIKYRHGFTGTLDDTLTHKLVLEGIFGPKMQVTKTETLIKDKTLARFNIKALVLGYTDEECKNNKKNAYPEEIDFLVKCEKRNKYICNLAEKISGNTLILYQFVEKHGRILHDMLGDCGKTIHFVHGGTSADERERIRKDVEKSDDNIIIASYGTFSTGINIKRLDNINFASPSKSNIRNLQSIGRVLRKSSDDNMATLYDIVDDLKWKTHENFAIKHFMIRFETYSKEGFDLRIYNINLKD